METVEFVVEFTDAEAMKALQLPMEALEELAPMLEATRAAARPKAVFARQGMEILDDETVRIGQIVTQSKVLATNLKNCDFGVSYVCTCGRELDDIARAMRDPMDGYLQDALNEMVLRKAIKELGALVAKRFHLDPIYAMAPGSLPDWPLTAQADLFGTLCDVEEQIGVRLTDSFLMLPIKSVSGIFFSGEEAYTSCMLCPREMCPNRRDPYDPALYEGKYEGAQTRFPGI